MNNSSKFQPACFGPFTSYFFIFLCQTPCKMWLNIKVSSETWYSTHQEPVYSKWTYNKSPTTLQARPFLLVDHTTKSIQHYHHQKWTLSISNDCYEILSTMLTLLTACLSSNLGMEVRLRYYKEVKLAAKMPLIKWPHKHGQWVLLQTRKWLFMLSAKIWTLSANVICKLQCKFWSHNILEL